MTNIKLYLSAENSDLTEGRGHTVITGVYLDPEAAVEAVKGRNVMGVGDGDVYEVNVEGGVWKGNLYENKIYGYRQRNGHWGYGYLNEPDDDPEYIEYLRLQKKYGRL